MVMECSGQEGWNPQAQSGRARELDEKRMREMQMGSRLSFPCYLKLRRALP